MQIGHWETGILLRTFAINTYYPKILLHKDFAVSQLKLTLMRMCLVGRYRRIRVGGETKFPNFLTMLQNAKSSKVTGLTPFARPKIDISYANSTKFSLGSIHI